MTQVNGIGPQVVNNVQGVPLPVVPPYKNPLPATPSMPLAGLISPPKLPPQGPYIPAPIAGLINPPKLPPMPHPGQPLAGLITPPELPPKNPTQPLGGLIMPPKNPAEKPQMPPEKVLDAIRKLLDEAKKNNEV